jgi:Protein of unknown function (DUF4230)
MPTLIEERPRAAAPAQEVVVRFEGGPQTPRRETRPRRVTIRGTVMTLLMGAIAVGVFLIAAAVIGIVSFNPFSTSQVDRTPPALLRQMKNLSQYHAAQGTFEVNVDVENDVNLVPSFIAGDRTNFNAIGTVDALVDFSHVSTDAVANNGDGSVTVTLPRPTYGKAIVDPDRSHIENRDRGLINRLAGIFSDEPTSDKPVYVLGEKKLAAAARESNLVPRAEKNTTAMLKGLFAKVGFSDVKVVFQAPPKADRALPASNK